MTAVLTPANPETETEPVVRRGRVALVVVAAIAGGLACALLLVAGPLAGGREHVITAALLAGGDREELADRREHCLTVPHAVS